MIGRRQFLTLLGGAAVTWPLAARAQQPARMLRIGVLMPYDENEPVAKPRLSAFTQALADLGWTDGRNVRMDLSVQLICHQCCDYNAVRTLRPNPV